MRKYQQLFLVVVSAISIICLFIYRSENSRLKYVLEVVNFFGKNNDEPSVHQLDNDTGTPVYDFLSPHPVWQRIGNGFYAYSAFWHKNPTTAGGEIITVVVGQQHSIVSFKCDLIFANGTHQVGKFGFTKETLAGTADTNSIEMYLIYRFRCKTQRDFGGATNVPPQSILFTETQSSAKHRIQVRNLNRHHVPHKLEIGLCLNLMQNDGQTDPFLTESHLLQHFYHHHLIGIDEIIVYDNGVLLSDAIRERLLKHKISIKSLQFNFPFEINDAAKIRRVIEIDCLLRTTNLVKYMIIAGPNEFMYPDTNVQGLTSFLKQFHEYAGNVRRFDVPMDVVCWNLNEKLLARNLLYKNEPKLSANEYFSVYRPSTSDSGINVTVDKLHVFAHRYENCNNKTEMYDWRATIGMRYLEYYDGVDMRVQALLEKQ